MCPLRGRWVDGGIGDDRGSPLSYIMCPLRGRTITINQQTKKTGRIVMTRPEMFNLGYMRLLYYCL